MFNGFEYQNSFVSKGWHPEFYELKLILLVVFVLVMSVVVNNALIGLAVGDTDEVMKTAKFNKCKRRVSVKNFEKNHSIGPQLFS